MRLQILCLVLGVALSIGCDPNAATSVSSNRPEVIAVAFNVAGDPTVEFSAPDMMCPEGCGEKVKEILSEQPGAKEVVVNFEAKTATVAVEKGKFDADAAIAALIDYGFEHSTLKTDDAPADAVDAPAEQPAG